ncbi:hypothetical protein JCM15765_08690 [Paradesulfitobacterium aromaticivorans]
MLSAFLLALALLASSLVPVHGQAFAPESKEKPIAAPVVRDSPHQISRGAPQIERRVMECTGYTDGKESTGKTPADPAYGQTASQTKTEEWYTVAAGPELPFGTKVYIPYFKDKPNRGIFVVEDRGVGSGHMDIYLGDPSVDETAVIRALEFGRRQLEVWILQ